MKINKLSQFKVSLMWAVLFVPFLLVSGQAQWWPNQNANQYPNSGVSRFRWEGVVDGTSTVRIRGRRVDVETYSGLPVQRQKYDFTDALPRTALNVQLVVMDGRGRVRLVESPRANNDFTAIVRIDDRSGGRDFYSFELRWNDRDYRDNGGGWSGNSRRDLDYVTWRGTVDGESIIRFRSDRAFDQTVNGQGIYGERYQFSAPLPSRAVDVNLSNTQGRGEILIVEQPSRANNFTTSVMVRDRQNGAGNYSFTLVWEKQNYRDADHGRWPVRDDYPNGRDDDRYDRGNGPNGRGISWSGRVDGRDLIYIRGNNLWVEHRDGQPVYEMNHHFYNSLPNRQCVVNVRQVNGRGNVRVIEQPSPYNNYTAVIQVEDRDGGSDFYNLDIDWQ
ncbi:MAG TPA: hypothetical protein PLK30_01550 [Blastocatellia bacterium]|nr:hypothetical protein [Blastocatellia bacterium]